MADTGGSTGWSLADVKAIHRPVLVEETICFDGAASAEIERLEEQLAAVMADDERENREPQAPAIAARILELGEQAAASERVFQFQGIGRSAWLALLDEHPPRDEDRDAGLDYNAATFPLVAIAASCVNPPLTTADVEWMADNLTLGQFSRLSRAALAANVGSGRPNSPSGTAVRLATGLSSTTAAPEESLSASSVEGL